MPVVSHYKQQGVLHVLDAERNKNFVANQIKVRVCVLACQARMSNR